MIGGLWSKYGESIRADKRERSKIASKKCIKLLLSKDEVNFLYNSQKRTHLAHGIFLGWQSMSKSTRRRVKTLT
jgi:hypothetical protein